MTGGTTKFATSLADIICKRMADGEASEAGFVVACIGGGRNESVTAVG